MEQNLWLYADKNERDNTAISLIAFGAGVFKRAKIIGELGRLKELKEALNQKKVEPSNPGILEYAFESLIDTVRIPPPSCLSLSLCMVEDTDGAE